MGRISAANLEDSRVYQNSLILSASQSQYIKVGEEYHRSCLFVNPRPGGETGARHKLWARTAAQRTSTNPFRYWGRAHSRRVETHHTWGSSR